MAHAYIQTEDLGLTVLGTTQYAYTVNGVHGQDFDTAVFRAALCRSVGVEEALSAYVKLVNARQRKLDDLGKALAGINEAVAAEEDLKPSTKIKIDLETRTALSRYGFAATEEMTYEKVAPLQQDVQYALDREDNEVQQDMAAMQSFLSKRDDAMKMAAKLMKKIAQTRARGIDNIGS